MKKNIFSVIITALTVINVVLTAIMFFVMLPTFQKTNSLITQVASVLNLELDADSDANADSNYTINDIEAVPVAFEAEQTYNLKSSKGENGSHYAMLKGYVINLNTKSDDYDSKMAETITNNQAQFTGIISNVIQSHTKEEATQDVIEKEALEKVQALLDNKVAVSVILNGYVTQ